MTAIGYALSSEEHSAGDLVAHARASEEAGFAFAVISDHFHPWIDRQGQSPFVWSVLGAISRATDRLVLGTGVTCPIIRIHPAVIAQAAATTASLLPGRFFLGVGTGERLNEHILGDPWPDWETRSSMLEEAVQVIRQLWTGHLTTHHGDHFDVENARIYSLPPELPPLHVAASGPRMAKLAGEIGDGLIGTGPERELVDAYVGAGGDGPRFGQITVCWAETVSEARRTAREWWPTAALHGNVTQELALPKDFEDLARSVDDNDIAEAIPCGPDAGPILDTIATYVDAGYDHVYLHQVGPDQTRFLRFARASILPEFEGAPATAAAGSR